MHSMLDFGKLQVRRGYREEDYGKYLDEFYTYVDFYNYLFSDKVYIKITKYNNEIVYGRILYLAHHGFESLVLWVGYTDKDQKIIHFREIRSIEMVDLVLYRVLN